MKGEIILATENTEINPQQDLSVNSVFSVAKRFEG